jgi:hypothetical protein
MRLSWCREVAPVKLPLAQAASSLDWRETVSGMVVSVEIDTNEHVPRQSEDRLGTQIHQKKRKLDPWFLDQLRVERDLGVVGK